MIRLSAGLAEAGGIVTAAWLVVAVFATVFAIPRSLAGEVAAVISVSLGLVAVIVSGAESFDRAARSAFVMSMAGVIAPGSILDFEVAGGRAKWGLIAAAFAILGRGCMRVDLPLRDFDRRRVVIMDCAVVGTAPAVALGVAGPWAIGCALTTLLSLVYDGRLEVFAPLFLFAFAFAAPYPSTLDAFHVLYALTALAILGPNTWRT